MPGILDGVKVLDLGRLMPHEYPTLIMADMGAEVLKIEEPGPGDYMREVGAMMKKDSAPFLLMNRNKQSLGLDIRTEEGKAIIKELIKEYNVLFHGFRPGVMDRLGLGYEELKKINPSLIYCNATGFGQNGKFKDFPGHDGNYIALAGVLWTSGRWTGKPVIPGLPFADMTVGVYSALAMVLAIFHREKTGEGQFLDISMTDTMVSYNTLHLAARMAGVPEDPRDVLGLGVVRPECPAYNVYETKDHKFMMSGSYEKKFWINFCKALGLEEFYEDQWARDERGEYVTGRLQEIFLTRTRDEWVEFMKNVDTCISPVNDTWDVWEDEHLKDREMFFEIDHPDEGRIKQIAIPMKFSQTPPTYKSPPPRLGEHTVQVMHKLGYKDDQLAQLKAKGVIV